MLWQTSCLVALGLKSLGHEQAFHGFVTVMMAIAFFTAFRLPQEASHLHHDR